MKLQEITANIRLRTPWEAVDLGFSMVQHWWKDIYIPLSILTFGIATLLYFIVPEDYFWLTGLVFWWLKPLYDRLVLHIISHKLFNNELTSWQALSALPSLIWNTGFFQSMTFRRLSTTRGFNLPIWQLEQLRGKPRSTRQDLLHLAAHSKATWLTITFAHLEMFFVLSLFIILLMFIPANMQTTFFDGLFTNGYSYSRLIDNLNYLFYVVVVTFVHPFYIAGNFSLYINRRTQLEAWDIELDFKKIGKRLKELSLVIFTGLTFSLSLATHSPTIADELSPITTEKVTPDSSSEKEIEYLSQTRLAASKSKMIIKEVMLTQNLDNKKIEEKWVKKKTDKKKKTKKGNISKTIEAFFKPFVKIMSFIVEFGLWILIGFGILLLFYYRDRWLHFLQGAKSEKKKSYQAPDVMFGMDVRPDSLPENIIGEAKKHWLAKEHREALSLLYRGALIRLINQEHIQLENSHTEGDVLHHAKKQLSPLKQSYLNDLTDQWKLIAYAHRIPAENDIQQLFTRWDSHFAINDSKQGDSHE